MEIHEFKKLKVQAVVSKQKQILKKVKKCLSADSWPEFDNQVFDAKLEKKKDSVGWWGKYVTDKITNPNFE